MNRTAPLLLLLLASALGAPASAAITVYTSQAAFLSAISGAATDTFDDLAPGSTIAGPIVRTAGPYAYTVTTAPTAQLFVAGQGADAWLSTNTATDAIVLLSFSAGVRAAGAFFFGTDLAGAFTPADLQVSASDGSDTATRTIAGATTGSFLGFVSTTPLASLTAATDQPAADFNWPTINDLTLGTVEGPVRVVPLPGSLALLLPGLLLAGMVARRR